MASSTERSRRFRARQARLEVEHEAGKLVADFRAWLKFRHMAEQTWTHYGWRVQRFARLLGANGVTLQEATTADLVAVWPSVGASYHNGLIEALRAVAPGSPESGRALLGGERQGRFPPAATYGGYCGLQVPGAGPTDGLLGSQGTPTFPPRRFMRLLRTTTWSERLKGCTASEEEIAASSVGLVEAQRNCRGPDTRCL